MRNIIKLMGLVLVLASCGEPPRPVTPQEAEETRPAVPPEAPSGDQTLGRWGLNPDENEHPGTLEELAQGRRFLAADADAAEARYNAALVHLCVSLLLQEKELPGLCEPLLQQRVLCCDGTWSPTCLTVKRGCCSGHGGVCSR